MNDRIARTRAWIARLHEAAAAAGRALTFMEVCGTHTVNACRGGLHSLMPPNVRLLSGPGCPVCVTSQADIDMVVSLATSRRATICTYGDMVRVTGSRGSLETARARGSDVRVVYSAMDAVALASAQRARHVVFAAVGFETTAPATAAAVLEAQRQGLTNFTVLTSHKQVVPAMRTLLETDGPDLHGFLCPGHVAVVIGADAFAPIVEQFGVPCAVCGFEDEQMARAIATLAELANRGARSLENCYPEAVSPGGNPTARRLIETVFEPADVTWRALGRIAGSGLVLRRRYALFDARVRFEFAASESPDPPGCRCGDVITGRLAPAECRLFARACTPVYPVGPCMVSSEGTCQAWFKYRRGASTPPRIIEVTS